MRLEQTRSAPMPRRQFLSVAAMGLAAAGLAGCSRAQAGSAAPVVTATYIPASYKDLYPGIAAFTDTAAGRSRGQLSFDLFDSGTLLGAEQLLPGLLLGAADVMFQTSSYVSSSYPVIGAMELPFVTEDFAQHRRAIDPDGPLHTLINERLALRGVRLLGSLPTSFEYLWTTDRPIRTPADVRGMRIRVAGEIEGQTVKAFGGAPVTMSSAEAYQALERGTIDGIMSYVGTIVSRDLQKVVRYGTAAHFGAYSVDAYCRADWYAEQNPVVQAALDAGGAALYQRGTDNMVTVHQQEYLPAVRDGGVEFLEPTPDEFAAFRAAVAPVYDHWHRMMSDPTVATRALDLIRAA